jgi:hypothetical protein
MISRVSDGHGGIVTTPITVTIDGTDDAPAIDAIAQRDLAEQTDTSDLTATIPVTFTDVDLTDVGHTAEVTDVSASGVTTGLVLDEAALIALITPETVIRASGTSSGSVLDFAAHSTAFDYLEDDEVLTLAYELSINDHIGPVTPQRCVITITRTSDFHVYAWPLSTARPSRAE